MKLFLSRMQSATAALLLASSLLLSQQRHPATNRPIADVMGFGGAPWLERPEREQEEAPQRALELIGIEPGTVIADVGAGTGYFTRRLAKRTGPTGKVYAVDIQPRMIEALKKSVARENLTNVEAIVSKEDDPMLPRGEIDLILMVDVYHEFAYPQLMLRKLREALKPEGRLVLLEFKKEDPAVPIRFEHKMSIEEARVEVEAEGFKLVKVISSLPRQHILIFKPGARKVN
ncbi:MAG: class I SAM-dependent methyltransferase [Bryobacteraceae bacterium]|nr:class I SAM-dependent methyltransferase [Bryobacteraceae bacterium]MDW8377426.1 class I SAM-dependent methyltransferase [Bryobacterales bacterium]